MIISNLTSVNAKKRALNLWLRNLKLKNFFRYRTKFPYYDDALDINQCLCLQKKQLKAVR